MQGKFKRDIKKIIKISMFATYYIYEFEYDKKKIVLRTFKIIIIMI